MNKGPQIKRLPRAGAHHARTASAMIDNRQCEHCGWRQRSEHVQPRRCALVTRCTGAVELWCNLCRVAGVR